MILLLDNNEYRRRSIYATLYSKKYIVTAQPLTEAEYLTKPFLTVYINPTQSQIERIRKENTICVVAKNGFQGTAPSWMRVIPLDNSLTRRIIGLYEELCPYNKGREIFGILCIEGNKFALGGAYLQLSYRQKRLVRFLAYNKEKEFQLFDISSYFDFYTDKDEGFIKMVSEINKRCKRIFKEPLIHCHNETYSISPSVINY